MWNSSCVSSRLNSFPSPCPSPPPNSGFCRHFAANANPVCSKWAVSAWNKRQLCPKLGRVSVSPGCLSQRGKGVSACSLAPCPSSLEKPALLLDIYPQLGVPSFLFAMPDANAWPLCCKVSGNSLFQAKCPRYWWAQDETPLTFGSASEWVGD